MKRLVECSHNKDSKKGGGPKEPNIKIEKGERGMTVHQESKKLDNWKKKGRGEIIMNWEKVKAKGRKGGSIRENTKENFNCRCKDRLKNKLRTQRKWEW